MSGSGSSSNGAGVVDNTATSQGGGVYAYATAFTLTSDTCDWGTTGSHNTPEDIYMSNYLVGASGFSGYGDDESFSCDASTVTCL